MRWIQEGSKRGFDTGEDEEKLVAIVALVGLEVGDGVDCEDSEMDGKSVDKLEFGALLLI